MKKSELLEKAIICVIENKVLPISTKLEILRVLMQEESLALYIEKEKADEIGVAQNG